MLTERRCFLFIILCLIIWVAHLHIESKRCTRYVKSLQVTLNKSYEDTNFSLDRMAVIKSRMQVIDSMLRGKRSPQANENLILLVRANMKDLETIEEQIQPE